MAGHVIYISDGEGIANLLDGNYNVASDTYGYDDMTISPVNIDITSEKNEYNFKLSASGMLMIYAYDGESGQGHQIEGATFYRCTRDGTKYGEPVITDSSGFAYMTYLPYDENYPIKIYFVQTASDGSHSFSTDVYDTHLTTTYGNSILVENPKIT